MKYNQNTLPTSGAWTADKGDEPEKKTDQELIDAAKYYYELPAWRKYQKRYGKEIMNQAYTIVSNIVNVWIGVENTYQEVIRDCLPETLSQKHIMKKAADGTLRELLESFSQNFHGNDDAFFELSDQLFEFEWNKQ